MKTSDSSCQTFTEKKIIMMLEIIFVDFNNRDAKGRVRLITNGSIKSIKDGNIKLVEGKRVQITDEELQTIGTLRFSEDEKIWVAEFHFNELKDTSQQQEENINQEEKLPKWAQLIFWICGIAYLIWLLFIRRGGPAPRDFPVF